jgi:hypothetical protein
MKAAKLLTTIAALLALSLAASAPVQAGGRYGGGHYHGGHGGHYYGHSSVHWGFYFGGWPYYGSWYYPSYPYYYPYGYPYYGGAVVVPSGPTTYVERGDQQAATERPAQSWWYYCAESKTYYPYVKQCPGGWQKVEPQPPAQ